MASGATATPPPPPSSSSSFTSPALKIQPWRWLQDTSTSSCGRLTKNTLEMTSGCIDSDCKREYYLYLPCSSREDAEQIPLLFAIHCFGCTADAMSHWTQEAEEFGFALVIPEGLHNAFNAKVCCGYPMEESIDDRAFLAQVQRQVLSDYSSQTGISPAAIYGMGWSNGGYMVTYAAELFRAIAPISGFQYDNIPELSPNHPVGMFLHHAQDDPMVRATGCCTDPTMPACCCGISDVSPDTCVSAEGFVSEFGRSINGCNVEEPWKDLTIDGVECKTSNGCQRNTTYCIHPEGKHFNDPSLDQAFPKAMREAIMDFFARDVCDLTQTTWNAEARKCVCNSHQSGRYCMNWTRGEETSLASSYWNASIAALLLVAAVGVVVGICLRRYKEANRERYVGFLPVASKPMTIELSAIPEDKGI